MCAPTLLAIAPQKKQGKPLDNAREANYKFGLKPKKKKKNKSENPIITLSLTPPCHRRWRLHLSSRIDQGMLMNLSSLLFGLCLCL